MMAMDAEIFEALPPIPETVLIGEETLDITPLKVGELPAFARAVRPVAAKLGPDPDWLRLFSEEGESVILALAVACRRPPEWVAALALDDAIRLAQAVFEANADFLSFPWSRKSRGRARASAKGIPGAMPSDGLHAGHHYPDVLGYTLAQVRAFLAACDRAERDDLAARFALLVTAVRGGSNEIQPCCELKA